MGDGLFQILEKHQTQRCFVFSDRPSGLRAFLVIDDLTLGPAAGGIRTARYPNSEAALREAIQLARTMTIKCALAGLDTGGGKAVVFDHEGLDRPSAFAVLGERIEEIGGMFRTAGDLGTTAEDLSALASTTQYVHTNEGDLSAAVAKGVRRAIEACAEIRERQLSRLLVAVQGCGSTGTAVARELATSGARLLVADLDHNRAESLAMEIDGQAVSADSILTAEVDVLSPCAAGGVITKEVAQDLRASAICGAANNPLAAPEIEELLVQKGILYVPDVIASAGAVIEGIGKTVMNLPDRTGLIDRIGVTTREVLQTAIRDHKLPTTITEERAWARIRSAEEAILTRNY